LFDIEHQQWTLRELREATGESKTNVLRVTKTLEGLGYLVRDPATRKLRLGPSIVRLSYVTLSHSELVRAAVEPMRRLSERLRETLDLMVEIELGSLMSLYDMTPRFLRTPPSIGRVVPCGVTTAASKIFVAFRPEETWDEILPQLVRPFTDRTILDLDQLRMQMASVKRDGVAFERGEWNVELCGVAAPIFGSDGAVRASLSVVSPVEQTGPEKTAQYADAVRETAAEISQELGAPVERVAFLRNRGR
jgi:DNA-binding IclR family transcriptional regulator